jgi:tetratricopeptide (TPR) repeat protein
MLLCGMIAFGGEAFAAGPQTAFPAGIIPKREIRMLNSEKVGWQELWTSAREAVRQNDLSKAIQRYQQLLAAKPDLEEARWELTRIRLRDQDWDKAADQLERLIEADPDRVAYLNALAGVLQEKAYYSRSVELFGRSLKNDPKNIEALVGMIQSLVKLRRKKEALLYLQRLHRLKPADRQIRLELARIAYETGDLETAATNLRELAAAPNADVELLRMAARVEEQLGLDNLAVVYRERILALKPDDRESHDRLATFYEKSGRTKEALAHFKALLEKDPNNPSLLHTIGRLLEDSGQFAEALPYFERYLALRPGDRQVLGAMVDIHAALGEKAETLASLERLLAVEPHPATAKVKMAARLYAEAGRPDQAIPLFRRVLAADPDDRESMMMLAEALTATGEDSSALALWRQVADLEPRRLAAFQAMAKILERQQRLKELLPVLTKIHHLDPRDEHVTLKLAAVYLKSGEVEKGGRLLDEVSEDTPLQQELLAIRGLYFEKTLQPAHALRVYEKLTQMVPEKVDYRLKCVKLAGTLGRLTTVRQHLAGIDLARADSGTVLIAAGALAGCGVDDEALGLYRQLLAANGGDGETERQQVLMTMAAFYRGAGLPYEAAQAYRMILPRSREVAGAIEGLFELALKTGDFDAAEIWLNRLAGIRNGPGQDLLRARFLSAQGEHGKALRLGRQAMAELQTRTDRKADAAQQDRAGLIWARLLLAAGHLNEARRQCRILPVASDPELELERLVLLQRIAIASDNRRIAADMQTKALAMAGRDAGALMQLASLSLRAGLPACAEKAARQAMAAVPDSLRARLLLAEALEEKDDLQAALAAVQEITARYPEHPAAVDLEAKLLFRTGDFEKVTSICEAANPDAPFFPELQLFQGRALWRQHHWQKALAAYEEYLTPSVDELFEEESAAHGVYYLPEKPSLTIWQLLSYKKYEPSAFIDRVMAPGHAADNKSQRNRDLNAVAAPLYARYRWQMRFSNELAARRSIVRREYFLAKDQFESLLEKYPDDETLIFDLAGLYSHFGDLGQEAVLYRRLKMLNPDFPGLAEAVERNRLKRRPRFRLAYDRLLEEGWDGYKAIRMQEGKAAFWYSPALQHEIDLITSRIQYKSTENDQTLGASRALLLYHTDFNDHFSLRLGGGVEGLDEGYPDTGLLDCKVTSRIGDKWQSYFSFVRDVTSDTLASLTRNIVRQDFRTGLGIDILPRLLVGADYSHTYFSDDNFTNGYDLWTSCIIFPEPTFLKVSYTYDFKDSQEGPRPGPPLADGFAAGDHPYWAPVNYWVSRVSFSFKHLLSPETFDRGIPRYYTLGYSLGYDSNGDPLQTFMGGFYLELSPRLLIETAAEITSSHPYRQSGLSLSAIYRW